MSEVPHSLTGPLLIALDAALPECLWRRRFLFRWREYGIDEAFRDWLTGPILNRCFIPMVEKAISDIKEWPYQPRS